jgi:hypothetical protein
LRYLSTEKTDTHDIVKYIQLKKHLYDNIEPANKFEFRAKTENYISRLYSNLIEANSDIKRNSLYVSEKQIDFYGQFEIDGKHFGRIKPGNIEKLLSLSKKSSFGAGTELKYDENVRLGREIEGSRLKIKSFNLNPILEFLREKFKCKLDANLYKLSIYEAPNGHFQYHKDNVHGNNHLGTLLIGLPIEYEGGMLNIINPYDSSKVESFKLFNNFLAFYTDCYHCVEKVTSGNRLALQYDLFYSGDGSKLNSETMNQLVEFNKTSSRINHSRSNEFDEFWLNKLVNELEKKDFAKEAYAFLLRHEYANKFLYPHLLKGIDKLVYDRLTKKFLIELRHVVLDVEKFSELELFYIKCKAFKRENEKKLTNSDSRQDLKKAEKNEQLEYDENDEENRVKLSDELKLYENEQEDENIEYKVENRKPIRINLVVTNKDKLNLIEKKKINEFTGNDVELVHEYIYFSAAIFINDKI